MPQSNARRFMDALSGAVVTPPAVAPLYLSLYLEPARRHLLAEVYREMAEGEEHLRLTFEDEIEAQVEAQVRALALLGFSPAWVYAGLGPSHASVHGAKVTFHPGQCLWHAPGAKEASVDYLAHFDNQHGDNWDKEPTDAGSKPVIVPKAEDFLADGQDKYPRLLAQRLGDTCVLTGSLGAPFWGCYEAFGFAGMMKALRDNPKAIHLQCQNGLALNLAYAEALKHAGTGVIFIEECLSSADLISLEDYKNFVYPYTRDLLQGLRDSGFKSVYYYCGDVSWRLELLSELPCDAFAFEESKKGFVIDLGEIRQILGPDRLLFGNTDVTLIRDGSAEEIAFDIRRQYEAAGPRFVISNGSPITLDTPPEKIGMMMM